ncbi:MAG: hypothetical protein Q4D71_13995, partial [Oscillospiraceae bacterium]|nr:hypothetical protein [Oscillospiraceae bacterium]
MTKKKLLTGLLIILLIILFTAGMKEKEDNVPVEPDIVVSPAGVNDTDSSSVHEEIQPADVTTNTKTPPVVIPVSEQIEEDESSAVKDAIEEDKQPVSEPVHGQNPVPAVPAPEEPREEPPAPTNHEHTWVDEIVAYHEAVTHIEHHDAVTEERWVSVPAMIQHIYCDVCHKEFSSQADAYAHEDATYQAAIEANDMSLIHAGHYSIEEY